MLVSQIDQTNNNIDRQSTLEKRRKLKRLRQPSKLLEENSEKLDSLPDQVSRRRRKETIEVCNAIHVGETENIDPTRNGLWHSLVNESTST